jgi:hypothetical protein
LNQKISLSNRVFMQKTGGTPHFPPYFGGCIPHSVSALQGKSYTQPAI